jgi:long-chain acyl-CoA synthetase
MLDRYVDGPEVPRAGDHFLTGDLGRLDSAGRLTITGRLTLLIDIGGVKVNPIEVEAILAEHPGVARCIVAPLRLSETVTRLRAIYEPRGAEPAAEDLRAFLRARMAPHKIPRVFEARPQMPCSPTGKLLRPEAAAL